MSLFGDDIGRVERQPAQDRQRRRSRSRTGRTGTDARVVEVVPDVAALGRALHYVEPSNLARPLVVGDLVRIPLNGRRVRGWVTALEVEPDAELDLEAIAKLTGYALDAEVIELCRWTARRWVGRLATLLASATPQRAVPGLSRRVPVHAGRVGDGDPGAVRPPGGELAEAVRELAGRGAGTHLLTVSPTTDPSAAVVALSPLGQLMIVTPGSAHVRRISGALRRGGTTTAVWPGGTADTLVGHTVVGGRGVVFAPTGDLRAIVVIDEHDERLQNESSPTWHAREVAIERARRAGVPCILISPTPSLEALLAMGSPASGVSRPTLAPPHTHQVGSEADGSPMAIPARERRVGWAQLVIVDRRRDDPRTGLFSPDLVAEIRRAREAGTSVICVLNRTGRARLLACRSCGSVAECERCGAAVRSDGDSLTCPRCATTRPEVCLVCGGLSMKVLRMGVTKARDDLEALLREPVTEVTAATPPGSERRAGVVMGTVAALNRNLDAPMGPTGVPPVGLVAFLDFDQELLATRYRASEEALSLLVDASRVVGGRSGRVLVQTRRPNHAVLTSATSGDTRALSELEWARRELLGLPPAAAIAAVGGEAAPQWIERLAGVDRAHAVDVTGPRDGWWLVRAPRWDTLSEICGSVERPKGRLRLQVNPMSLPT